MDLKEEMKKHQHRCCFTGPRPEKLNQPESVVDEGLEREIRKAISDGFTTFISGMARGVDIWAAEIVLRLRSEGQPIKLVCASPYKGFEENWCSEWQQRYNAVLNASDFVLFICPRYSRSCFQRRNEWMVDRCARVIAVFNGEPGGARNTIRYAEENGVEVAQVEL